MKKSTLLLMVILMVSASIVYAEPKAKKKRVEQTQKEAKKYTDVQIDINTEKLTPNYYGNNPKTIYSVIKKRKDSAKKGEFETSEQFHKRLAKEKTLPLIGKINSDGLFSLQASRPEVKYSADISEISVVINLKKIKEPLGYGINKSINPSYEVDDYNENAKVIPLSSKQTGSRSYVAQNSYGATTVVKDSDYESYNAAVNNCNELPFEVTINASAQRRYDEKELEAKTHEVNYGSSGKIVAQFIRDRNTISNTDKEWRMSIKIKASPEEAKSIKDKLRVLLIANLSEPLIYDVPIFKEATMDCPLGYMDRTKYIYINLNEIWVYNQATGQIYSKIKKTFEPLFQ